MMNPMKRWRSHTLFLQPLAGQEGFEAALQAWEQWCAQHAGSRCELALSSQWVMPCAGAPAQALPQWAHYMDLNEAVIDASWVLRATDAAPALSCIAPRALIEGLQQAARQHRVSLDWVGPWWAWAVQGWLNQADAGSTVDDKVRTLEVIEPAMVTRVRMAASDDRRQTLDQVWTQRIDASLDKGEGAERIDLDVAADASLSPWTHEAPSRWKPRWAESLDFIGPRVHVALWSWALLVLGLAVGMAVADQAQTLQSSQDEVQATLRRLERAQHQQKLATAAPRAASSADAAQAAAFALDAAKTKQAARVSQLLAYPWAVVISRMEQAAQQEHAVLTGFSLDISSLGGKADAVVQARLQAALPDDASALRWVSAHGDGAQLLGRDLLASPFETEQGAYALRAEASWAAGGLR